MVSEGVQTNGFNRTTTSDQQTSPPNQIPIRPLPQQQPQPPLPPYKDPPPPPLTSQSPQKKPKPEIKQKPALPPYLAASQMHGYKLQVYHLDGNPDPNETSTTAQVQASWYGTAPRYP